MRNDILQLSIYLLGGGGGGGGGGGRGEGEEDGRWGGVEVGCTVSVLVDTACMLAASV